MRLSALTAATLLCAGAAVIANAAEPSSGTISNASPKVEWGGTVLSAGVTDNAWAQDPTAPCEPPACDTFALEVVDAGNVALTLTGFAENTAGGDPTCGIRVIRPDGSAEYTSGTCGPQTTMKVTLKNAPAGNYTVDIANSHVANPTGPEPYKASATLATAVAPAPTPAPGAAPAPSATPAPAAEIKLTAKVPAVSAKKLKKAKKLVATLKSTGALKNVNALLVNKSKKLGAGKLASLNGTAKITVKVKKAIKPGSYQLSVGGRDAQGRNVVATAKVKVKK